MNSGGTSIQERRPDGAEGESVVSILSRGATKVVKDHPKISTSYLIGILFLLFGTGFKVSEDLRDSYDRTLDKIDFEGQQVAHGNLWEAKQSYDRSKGWFSCDRLCTQHKKRYDAAQATWDKLKAEEYAVTKEAKSQLGIFSEYGVAETRDVFWRTFAGGKDFAKRQSMWDMLFAGLSLGSGRKDEDMFGVVLKWLVQLLFNFTLGLCGALVVFLAKLWGVISAYSPDPLTAALYFAIAAVSATACVATYLLILYGAAGGTVAVVVKKIADHNHRLETDPEYRRRHLANQPANHRMHRQPQGFAQQRRAHYD